MQKSAVAIRHVAFEDLGSAAEVLEAHGYAAQYLEAAVDELNIPRARDADLLVVLGGPIGAHDEPLFPFLSDELALLEYRLESGRATLGICLGAQLMARALGARVFPGGKKEIGWSRLKLTEPGAQGALSPLTCPVFHWHGDTFDLPAGAVHLAASDLYDQQAFAWQRHGLALQFHLEATARGLERWYVGHSSELASSGIDVRELRAAAREHGPALERAGRQALGAWLRDLG
jgi:GMP synthase (glutamine-hydrolysing)